MDCPRRRASTPSTVQPQIDAYTAKITSLAELCGDMLGTISKGDADGTNIAVWEQRLLQVCVVMQPSWLQPLHINHAGSGSSAYGRPCRRQVAPEHAVGIFSAPSVRHSLSRPSSVSGSSSAKTLRQSLNKSLISTLQSRRSLAPAFHFLFLMPIWG